MVAGVMVMIAAAGAAAAVTDGFGQFAQASTRSTPGEYHTSTAAVAERSLTSQTQVQGTLGYAGAYSVVNPGSGGGSGVGNGTAGTSTYTQLPAAGKVVHQGQELYAVSSDPVVLLYGTVPAYRSLSEGMNGADVTELNHDLVRLGYANRSDVAALGWDYFGWDTIDAVEALQARLGETQTGTLSLGQAVFLPTAIKVTALGADTVLGGPAASGNVVLTATSTTPVVAVSLDPSLQMDVKDGDKVSVTLPSGDTASGEVSSVGTAATTPSSSNSASSGTADGSSGSATIAVTVSLADPKAAAGLDQAQVTVTVVTGRVGDALVLPVTALLAQPDGSYAVEVTGPGGHRLVTVTLGLFDDAHGLVQVSGRGLSAGQRVVVPGT